MDVRNKHICVVGAARSGVAAAVLLKKHGADVQLTDIGMIGEHFKKKLIDAGIKFEENGHSKSVFEADMLVASPGVPTEAPIMQEYLRMNKPVLSELELASRFTRQPIVAITGTNGKTTVTSWIANTWKTAGLSYELAGNIGFAFSEKVETLESGHFILEVSSFQLDHISHFKPSVSLLLNITPDHLNRYNQSFDMYAASKFKITENQTGEDVFIYNYDDEEIRKRISLVYNRQIPPKIWSFSVKTEVPEGAFVREGNLIFKFNSTEETIMPIQELSLPGTHNLYNGLATALAARAAEIKNEAIRESLQQFEGVEHRLELVRILDGVRYINDSKATNVNAVWYALDSMNVPMVLILGGRDKGNKYAGLIPQIKEKVHSIIAIGESKHLIEEQLGNVVPHFYAEESMKRAVRKAQSIAKRGEVVLLSPACASFDMFEDYEHRGKVFKEEVYKL